MHVCMHVYVHVCECVCTLTVYVLAHVHAFIYCDVCAVSESMAGFLAAEQVLQTQGPDIRDSRVMAAVDSAQNQQEMYNSIRQKVAKGESLLYFRITLYALYVSVSNVCTAHSFATSFKTLFMLGMTKSISRVSDQNGVSLLYIMLEIHHSDCEPLIYADCFSHHSFMNCC